MKNTIHDAPALRKELSELLPPEQFSVRAESRYTIIVKLDRQTIISEDTWNQIRALLARYDGKKQLIVVPTEEPSPTKTLREAIGQLVHSSQIPKQKKAG